MQINMNLVVRNSGMKRFEEGCWRSENRGKRWDDENVMGEGEKGDFIIYEPCTMCLVTSAMAQLMCVLNRFTEMQTYTHTHTYCFFMVYGDFP